MRSDEGDGRHEKVAESPYSRCLKSGWECRPPRKHGRSGDDGPPTVEPQSEARLQDDVSDEPKTTGTGGLGCALVTGLMIAAVWVVWTSIFGCFLADNFDYVTKQCALKHLQRPACNVEQDILGVDEIDDISRTDEKGKRVEMRSVIYQFKKRPLNGPVSGDVLRDTQTLYKDAQGHWKASCEQ